MTKKQILIASMTSGLTVILLAGASILYMIAKTTTGPVAQSNVANSGIVSSNLNNNADTVPLGQEAEPRSQLSVDDSASFSPNLGSGGQANGSGDDSAPPSNESANDFKQYDQYKDKQEVYFGEIKEGNGAAAQKDSQLAVYYKGYLTDGTMFDQSRTDANGQKEPLLFTLGSGKLIPGFEQGVAGMKAGGTRRIIIPPSLAYGDKEQSGIPANSVLIFDVQLLTLQ